MRYMRCEPRTQVRCRPSVYRACFLVAGAIFFDNDRMIVSKQPALVLAPMEGVTDAPMRAVQGEVGAFTYAVSEFVRISHSVTSRTIFEREVPELNTGMRTLTGLPVQIQLLGGDANRLAASAVVAHEAGAQAIDLNFGCPARTVNRHDGGATLLKHPTRIRAIVAAVRSALPAHVPVSAKLRLGWDNIESIFENAAMAAAGGASWLTIHARTRDAGYAPPVYWPQVGRVRERLGIPIIANGDIWTLDDFRRCRAETGCEHFMLGRGALANPLLAMQVAHELGLRSGPLPTRWEWPVLLQRLINWTTHFYEVGQERALSRLKQWLSLAAKFGNFTGFDRIKRAQSCEEVLRLLA
jgi:tRNA-dihydrouridine synthase C